MAWSDRISGAIAARRRVVITALLLMTVIAGSGMIQLEESSSMGAVEGQSDVMQADEYVESNFTASGENETRALVAVRNESGNVLSKQSLVRSLEYQQRLRENETVNETLAANESIVGIGNIVARAAMSDQRRAAAGAPESGSDPPASTASEPTLDEELEQLRSMNASQIDATVSELFRPDASSPLSRLGLQLLPSDYEVGASTAEARLIVITQETQIDTSGPTVAEPTIEGQEAVRDIAQDHDASASYLAVGDGLLTAEETQSMTDSFTLVGPLALLLVLAILIVSYRDLLDVLLGLFGVVVVLVWTLGIMGWAGIEFNQIMIAVPVLLIGLSIDFAVHVVMRYREERSDGDRSVPEAMQTSLSHVGVALALVTTTTAIGFLTNLTSSLPAIRNFGIASTVGIVSALLVFGAFIPALKIELDGRLERLGFDRQKRAFGTGNGRSARLLRVGVTAAKRAPVLTLALVLVLTAASGYAALQVDSSFSEERFVADDPPEWMESLPASMEPGEYTLKENLHYVESTFQTPDKRSSVLIRGDVTDPETMAGLNRSHDVAADNDATYIEPGGDPAIQSPLTLMDRVADRNETFNETLTAADTDGDGVPDRNVEAVYDGLYGAAPEQASQFIYRTDDGEYAAIQLLVSVDGTASPTAVSEQMGTAATDADWSGVTTVETGGPVVDKAAMQQVASTVVESLALAIAFVFVLLMLAFWLSGRRPSLGAVTLIPTLLSVTWILGTMYLLDIPFSFTTAVVGSISVGLGVDYAIHVSERYGHELASQGHSWDALETTIRGTGGALLSSAVTTASAFGVLVFTLLPGLRQFGLIIALSILYAFVSSVFVLPSVLALWTRYVHDVAATPAASDGVSTND